MNFSPILCVVVIAHIALMTDAFLGAIPIHLRVTAPHREVLRALESVKAIPFKDTVHRLDLANSCRTRQATRFQMSALGPIGPFTPFRSTYCSSGVLEREMSQLSSLAEGLSSRFGRLVLGFQTGVPPPKAEVANLAEEMRGINEQWRVLLTRLALAQDFQALEFFKMTEARLKTRGLDFNQMEEAMRWQVDSMLAYANDKPPPMPPAFMMQQNMAGGPGSSPGGAMGGFGGFGGGSASGITALPFLEHSAAVSSPVVREELDALVRDHKALVRLGESYGKWDRAGRLAYIDQLEAVEERWGLFLKRFELMGKLNPEFVAQTEDYLRRLDLRGAEDFKALLKTCRDIMRADAERL